MTAVIRMVSAFFLALLAGSIISTANGLDPVSALQGSVMVAWICAAIVYTLSLVIASVHALPGRLAR